MVIARSFHMDLLGFERSSKHQLDEFGAIPQPSTLHGEDGRSVLGW